MEVECTIGFLKTRWQSLKGLPIQIRKQQNMEYAVKWIASCCVLHNIVHQMESSHGCTYILEVARFSHHSNIDDDIENMAQLIAEDQDEGEIPIMDRVSRRAQNSSGEAKRRFIQVCGEPVIKIGHYPISEDISKGGTSNHKPASHIIHISVKTFL